jgi:heme/copper-type cytochrome/quinol oxidase subunit 1
VLIAFTGVTAELILPWDRSVISEPLARMQAYLYGGGISIVALAMFWAALLGGERRGYFITVPAKGPAVMLTIGGITAGIGILAFIANTFGALTERPSFPSEAQRTTQ